MRRALLILSLDQNAVFTARAATEGDHQTLDYVPGSALLGAAAAKLYNRIGAGDPFDLFHSGSVRFSNAVPLTSDGVPTFPLPQVLRQPKHTRGGIRGGIPDRLDDAVVRLGEDRTKPEVQYDALPRCHVGADLSVVRPRTGRRLRTALKDGRAEQGRLFGYSHVEAGQAYAATIEADGLGDCEWQSLMAVFDGTVLSLGRSRRAEYGGEARCSITDDFADFWPAAASVDGARPIVVWALSDLAVVVRATGLPTLAPRLEDLFPDDGISGPLDRSRSAIGQRRYAPWNSYLGGRESERCVIAAGSVLWFATVSGDIPTLPALIGEHLEAGLGRIWINPPMLKDWGQGPEASTVRKFALPKPGTAVEPSEAAPAGDALMSWMQLAASRRTAAGERDRISADGEAQLQLIYRDVRLHYGPDGGPSRSQWGDVLNVLRTATTRADVMQRLFENAADMDRAICGVKSDKDRQSTWGATFINDSNGTPTQTTITEWLKNTMEAARKEMPLVEFIEAFEVLAKCGQRLAQQESNA